MRGAQGGLYVLLVLLVFPIVDSVRSGVAPQSIPAAVVLGALFVSGQRLRSDSVAWQRYSVLLLSAAVALSGLVLWGSPWVVGPVLVAVTCANALVLIGPAVAGVVTVAAASAAVSGEVNAAIVVGGAGTIAVLRARLMAEIAVSRAGREALARAAVENERLRIARDLHDLLGHSLATMVVKAELAEKLAPVDATLSAQAARDVQSVGRAAMVEVGEAVTGYRTSSLDAEITRARDALGEIAVKIDVAERSWSADVDAVLAWAVREATTNVLRHADATTVAITVRTDPGAVILKVVNDNASQDSPHPGSGQGLVGLTERVDTVGGTVTTNATEFGFELVVTAPIEAIP
ncbi:sensor histidine kinase [Actinomycetes bacterium M1A6_2h]